MRIKYFNFFNYTIFKNTDFFCNVLESNIFIDLLFIFKNSLFYLNNTLIDVFVTDYIYFLKRFRLCYNICSVFYKNSVFVNCNLKILDSFISVYIIFKSSIWVEREVYDMFGVKFINNWDLRRILTDYTFFGFPLRKDFPLSGYVELLYDESKKTTFETLIELMQEMRFFYVSSPIEMWDFLELKS